ncbi:MAG: DUF3047 domain-containing protein [Spirochaetaceae bacterium]|nr:MAG: DUF3047 domain-containing protein [Spirochaetaceae bacterium]
MSTTSSRWLLLPAIALTAVVAVAGSDALIYEEFTSLRDWADLEFRNIDQPSKYSIERENDKSLLFIESDDGGSGIVHSRQFNVYQNPIIEWRWRIEDIISSGDLSTRDGDTYPVRIYVNFEYDPDLVGLGTRIRYGVIRRIYGEYPPHASLLYIWSNRTWQKKWYDSPFTSRARMLPIDQGAAERMQWKEHRRNMVEDYREAFGEDPPETAQLAIMGDAYGSGEISRAWIDFIRVGPATD